LNQIETSIENAEFYKNRSFVFTNLSYEKVDFDAIMPEYKAEIDNWFDNIPDYFKAQKKEAYSLMGRLEDIYDYLKKIIETLDLLYSKKP
jgi:hypothetical protein